MGIHRWAWALTLLGTLACGEDDSNDSAEASSADASSDVEADVEVARDTTDDPVTRVYERAPCEGSVFPVPPENGARLVEGIVLDGDRACTEPRDIACVPISDSMAEVVGEVGCGIDPLSGEVVLFSSSAYVAWLNEHESWVACDEDAWDAHDAAPTCELQDAIEACALPDGSCADGCARVSGYEAHRSRSDRPCWGDYVTSECEPITGEVDLGSSSGALACISNHDGQRLCGYYEFLTLVGEWQYSGPSNAREVLTNPCDHTPDDPAPFERAPCDGGDYQLGDNPVLVRGDVIDDVRACQTSVDIACISNPPGATVLAEGCGIDPETGVATRFSSQTYVEWLGLFEDWAPCEDDWFSAFEEVPRCEEVEE